MASDLSEHKPHTNDVWESVRAALGPLASLKFTVVLFAMAIFIVLAGTLGQTDLSINQTIEHYFRMPRHLERYTQDPWGLFDAMFARIQFKIFFPESFFPEMPKYAWMENHFYFPKGWTIGALMFVNLLAAHLVRFRIQAKSTRLWTGCATLVLGCVLTYAVIHSGAIGDDAGVQDAAALSWETIWLLLKIALAALWLVVAVAIAKMDPERRKTRIALGVGDAVFGAALAWAFIGGAGWSPDPSSMRILWQLVKATVAGLVLLAGCYQVFEQRAGIVLLHAGVGLMMFSELLVGVSAVESHLTAQEGQAKNYSEVGDEFEIAVVDPSTGDRDDVVVVPLHLLEGGETVESDELPFALRLVQYIPNAPRIRAARAEDGNPATAGVGLKEFPISQRPAAATDANQQFNSPAVYVDLSDKDGKSLGVYMLPVVYMRDWVESRQTPEKITVGDKTYEVSLRYRRIYRPFWIEVIDAEQKNYTGSAMARSYSSDVRVVGADGRELLKTKIWMNNPLRYAGETYYQSGFIPKESAGADTTTLQVVTNKGWMIPYVSCMIVGVGMLFHFSTTLVRFIRRRARDGTLIAAATDWAVGLPISAFASKEKHRRQRHENRAEDQLPWLRYLPVGVAAIAVLWAASNAIKPSKKLEGMDLEAAGQLPVMDHARCKPLDSLARSTLRVLSKQETFVDSNGVRQPAIRWLLDTISGSPDAAGHRVLKIENFDVQEIFGLSPRKGYLYSLDEVSKGEKRFLEEYERAQFAARDAGEHGTKLSLRDAKILEFANRYQVVRELLFAFQSRNHVPDASAFEGDEEKARQKFSENLNEIIAELEYQRASMDVKQPPPLAVPTKDAKGEPVWVTLVSANVDEILTKLANPEAAARMGITLTEPSDARKHWSDVLAAYKAKDADRFNDAVAAYRAYLDEELPIAYSRSHVQFEAFFNRVEPFFVASVLYLFVFVLAALAWLGWSGPLNRSAFWLAATTLVLHTLAIAARVYISGRPPVTTLYSSAVFIGWGCVLLALVMESIFRIGLGNVVAGITGSATLLIAHFLALDGDTFEVLQPVLDTQFWLATHVVTVTLGYATTFMAGKLGLIYVFLGMCTPALDKSVSKVLARMIYGSLCFAIFFSFVGTVLGGLWADDSWGRFWGWDPKENGALIIVLWNALLLHARWDGWIKDRGMAVMAMVGNAVTAWSWFGVNNLGVGLHSYGKSEAAINALLVFWVVQVAIVGVGMLPRSCWWSFRAEDQRSLAAKTARGAG